MHRQAVYFLLTCVFLTATAFSVHAEEATAAHAEKAEHGEKAPAEGEEKKQPEEKPRPDSAVSFVWSLPEVKKWQNWLASQHNGDSLSVWGEAIKQVDNNTCSDIAVAEVDSSGDNPKIWVRFCVTPGGSVLVEKKPKEPFDDITYLKYDDWKKQCNPTYKSPGIC